MVVEVTASIQSRSKPTKREVEMKKSSKERDDGPSDLKKRDTLRQTLTLAAFSGSVTLGLSQAASAQGYGAAQGGSTRRPQSMTVADLSGRVRSAVETVARKYPEIMEPYTPIVLNPSNGTMGFFPKARVAPAAEGRVLRAVAAEVLAASGLAGTPTVKSVAPSLATSESRVFFGRFICGFQFGRRIDWWLVLRG